MTHHACFAVPNAGMDVVIIDSSKASQGIIRSIVASMKVARIRTFDGIEAAMQAMLTDSPNLIIAEWGAGKDPSAQKLLRVLRARFMAPLCYVPVIAIASEATRSVVEKAMRSGAHLILLKPIAPAALIDRITWLQHDARKFVLSNGGIYEIEGIEEKLRDQRDRTEAFRRAASQRLMQVALSAGVERREEKLVVPTAGDEHTARWQAFLKSRQMDKAGQGQAKSPEETLKNMPRISHYAALRGR